MTLYHGTVLCELGVGDELLPVNKSGQMANPRFTVDLVEQYEDGVSRHDHDVIWLSEDKDDAANWGSTYLLKVTGEDVRQMEQDHGGPVRLLVYEVEPLGPVFRRRTPHSPGEVGCERARVSAIIEIEVYDWRNWYDRDEHGRVIDPYTDEVLEG